MTTPEWESTGAPDHDVVATLVERATGGDRAAFGELYREFQSLVKRVASRHMQGAQDADIDDVVSEVFCKALENIHRFTLRGGGFPAWLATLARGEALKTHRRKERPSGKRDLAESQLTCDTESPVEAAVLAIDNADLAAEEMLPQLVVALEGLPHRQGEVVKDRVLHHRQVSDLAAELGVSKEAVNALRYRGVKALRGGYAEAVA